MKVPCTDRNDYICEDNCDPVIQAESWLTCRARRNNRNTFHKANYLFPAKAGHRRLVRGAAMHANG